MSFAYIVLTFGLLYQWLVPSTSMYLTSSTYLKIERVSYC